MLGLSGAAAASAAVFPYRLPVAAASLVLLALAHVVAARRRRWPVLLWVGTALSVGFVAVSVILGASMARMA